MATTFASSTAILWITVIIGILGSFLLYSETAIITYFKQSKWKTFSFGDIMVFFGVIVATALLVFSLSLIPTIGQILPVAIINFTTVTARIIAVIGILVALVFVFTPRYS